jgi:Thioredoxin domain
MAISVQVQMSPGCGHGRQTVELVRDVLAELAPGAPAEILEVRTADEAERLGFRGSPTVLVDGADIDPGPPSGTGLG